MKRKLLAASLFAISAAVSVPASADPIVLNFENIAPYPNGNNVFIEDYYNGGTSSIGTSGTNFGVDFSPNSLLICLNTLGTTCSNTSRGGLAPGTEFGGLFFLSGDQSLMNVSAGFTTGFSFNYVADNVAGSVSVFDGLDGTGNLLATLALPVNGGSCPGFNAGFCPFQPIGVAFAGTARSVSFAGVQNQIVFDDITFGSIRPGDPGAVPEPSTWMLLMLGFFGTGFALRRRKTRTAVSYA